MKKIWLTCVVVLFVSLFSGHAYSQLVVIEPDDFAEGTDLREINPLVSMVVTTSSFETPFAVTANADNMGLASTGTMVFGHANVPFWNGERRLQLDFNTLVSEISIDVNGDFTLDPEIGILEIYNSDDVLLDVVETNPLSGVPVTLSLSRQQGDIARAVAYASNGPFLRLDNLSFSVAPIPEPTTASVLAIVSICALLRRRRT